MKSLAHSIARVCHEVNAEYCRSIGDVTQPRTWEEAPEWQQQSAIKGVELHLANPDVGPAASHEAWMREKLDDGWTYGKAKDPEAKTHPCLVPFADLPKEQQIKDWIFRAVVHSIAREMTR